MSEGGTLLSILIINHSHMLTTVITTAQEKFDILIASLSTLRMSGTLKDLITLRRMLCPVQVWIIFLGQPHSAGKTSRMHSKMMIRN